MAHEDHEYVHISTLPSYDDSLQGPRDVVEPSQRHASPYAIKRRALWLDENRIVGELQNSFKFAPTLSSQVEPSTLGSRQFHEYITNFTCPVPPRPYVRIHGEHRERRSGQESSTLITDFDIELGLQGFLDECCSTDFWASKTIEDGVSTHRGNCWPSKGQVCERHTELGNDDSRLSLMAWCTHFCNASWPVKLFRVSRTTAGWDTGYIKDQLEGIVRSTNYRGKLEISFGIVDSEVDLYTPHWVNKLRLSWVRYIFYWFFLWVITWPILLLITKRWNVCNVEWRYSNGIDDKKTYAECSEEEWLKSHANLVASLALDRYKGDATDFTLEEYDAAITRAISGTPQSYDEYAGTGPKIIHGRVVPCSSCGCMEQTGGWAMNLPT